MNLAFFGFSAVGLLFTCYAFSFYRVTSKGFSNLHSGSYACGYFSVALAFLTWSIAVLYKPFPQTSILAGDAFLLLSTLCFLNVLINCDLKARSILLAVASVVAILLFWLRSTYYPPQAYVENGVLVFNTPLAVAILLDAVFLFVWLPTNLYVARIISKAVPIEGMPLAYSFIYAILTVSAILFIAFKTVPLIIISFIIIGISFILLFASNYIISTLFPSKL